MYQPLTVEQMLENWKQFRALVNKWFPSRSVQLNAMYDELEERLVDMPASGVEHYHNAFQGGYIEHVLRVMKFSVKEYEHWKSLGLKVDNFTVEELLFAAMHHDLGKVGLPNDVYSSYQMNKSEWHRKNLGKIYVHNPLTPFTLVPDTSLFLLQHYGVKCSWQEQLAIRTHDGVYDEANKAYYFSGQFDSKSRTNINQILHNADFAAARFEFERWVQFTGKQFFYEENAKLQPPTQTEPPVTKKVEVATSAIEAIDKMFK